MKLKNKKTGEIKEVEPITIGGFRSLSELNEEWEDYEEPKEYWFLDTYSYEVSYLEERRNEDLDNFNKEIGNYFETEEEAEKAVEKLKAWKRLKDKGFRFTAWYGGSKNISYEITSLENETYIPRQICDDLDLLFGDEK